MSDKDPYLLNVISGRKPPAEEPEIDLKKQFGEAEKARIHEAKQDAEDKKANELYDKILKYHESFPFVADGGPKKAALSKMGLKELEREMSRIQKTLNSRSALAAVKKIDYGINWGIEQFLIMNKVPAMGLANFTASKEGQEMLAQEYQEFAIEYQDWLATSKEARYFWTTISKIMMIIEFNKKNMDAPVDEDLEKEGESGSDEE